MSGKLFSAIAHLLILSPSEIDPEVDFDSRRAVYFRQMRYGLFVRIQPWLLACLD